MYQSLLLTFFNCSYREDKLAVKRQQQAIDEIKDCTFIPKVPIPASTSLGGRARSGSKSSNKQPLYEEASSLVPEQGSGKSSSTNTNSKPIEEAPKVRFREGGNNQHVDNYNDWQVPSAPQPPQRTTDYSAFDFGDDEYTPKVSVNRVRPPVVPSQHIPSQPYQQQPSYPQSNPPQYYSQPPSQHQPVQQQYLPPQYAAMSSRPTDLQEPDDYPQSPSSWIPPQQYGADFNALELKAQKALRNSFPSSEGSQYSDISYDQQPPSNYYQQQGYYPQQQMPLPQSYPRSPTNPYNMHYYADPQDDDMSQAVEL